MTSRDTALRHFKRVDPHFYATTRKQHTLVPEEIGARRTRAQLFEALARTVVSQQLATKAASSIFKRVREVCGTVTPESILHTPIEALRGAGLSGSKVKTLQAIATAVQKKEIDLLALKKMPEVEAAQKLQQIWGLGPWSAEMFLMFSVGSPDVFSAGDLGLIRAMETIYNLPKDTPREKILAITEKWSPYRTFASLLLWRFRDAN